MKVRHGCGKLGLHMDAKVFYRAAELIEQGHCKGKAAVCEVGYWVNPQDSSAVSWCLTGAVERAAYEIQGVNARDDSAGLWTEFSLRIKSALVEAMRQFEYESIRKAKSLPAWNNRPQTRPNQVIKYLRAVANILDKA